MRTLVGLAVIVFSISEPIDLTDGGTYYCDAVFVVELRKFARMKQTGPASHTVAIHGVA